MTTRRASFTLVELLVAMLVSSILIGVTVSVYSLFRASIYQDQMKADITQNARVAMDRLSRELRQANNLVTELPEDPSDVTVVQPNEIEFEDGHTNDLTYRRYYVEDGRLKLEVKEYSTDGVTRLKWNDPSDPVADTVSTTDIAVNVQSFEVYHDQGTLQLLLTTSDNQNQSYQLRTYVTRRN